MSQGSLLASGLEDGLFTFGIGEHRTGQVELQCYVIRGSAATNASDILLYMHGSGGPCPDDKMYWPCELAKRKRKVMTMGGRRFTGLLWRFNYCHAVH